MKCNGFSSMTTMAVYTQEFTCRICLSAIIFDDEELADNNKQPTPSNCLINYQEQLELLQLNINDNDELPQKICADCLNKLNKFNEFYLLCQQSQILLKEYFKCKTINDVRQCEEEIDEEMIIYQSKVAPQSPSPPPPPPEEEEVSTHKVTECVIINTTNDYYDDNISFETTVLKETENLKLEIDYIDEVEDAFNEKNDGHTINRQQKRIELYQLNDELNIVHEKHELLECDLCGKHYKRKPHLLRHLKNHTETQHLSNKRNYHFICTKCGKRFSKLETLQQHEIGKTTKCIPSDNPKCRFCHEIFNGDGGITELELHLAKNHPPDRPHICPICKKSFQSVSNRNTHLHSHNKENAHSCEICDQGFKSKVYLKKHMKAVHTKSEHQCGQCGQQFDTTIKFEYHLKSHNPNKKYKCKYCDKSFLQHHHLANHERTHTGHRPFLCNICGKDFKQECNFKLHLRIHTGVRPHICNICGKDFVQRGSYLMHMRLHSDARPYQCEHCGKGFIQKSSLNVHIRTHTGERPFKCDSCDRAFVQAQQLKYHCHSAHGAPLPQSINKNNNKNKIVIQENTINSLNDSNYVIQHQKQDRILPYICHLCNRGYKLPSSLSSHMKSHNEERKHVCTQCGNSFKRAEHLRIHINGVHLKQKPYKCDQCSKTFSQVGDRNIHMRRHTGEKPYQCTVCKKNFRLVKAMRSHMRIHTGEKPYKCEICHMDFMTYAALATHNFKHESSASLMASNDQDKEILFIRNINDNKSTNCDNIVGRSVNINDGIFINVIKVNDNCYENGK